MLPQMEEDINFSQLQDNLCSLQMEDTPIFSSTEIKPYLINLSKFKKKLATVIPQCLAFSFLKTLKRFQSKSLEKNMGRNPN